MKGQLIIIPARGSRIVKELTAAPQLQELQEAVCGSIEAVPYWDTFDVAGSPPVRCVAFCNEDGKQRAADWRGRQHNVFATNLIATLLWERCLARQGSGLVEATGDLADYIAGPVAVITGDDELLTSL